MHTPDLFREISRLTGLKVTPTNAPTLEKHIGGLMRARRIHSAADYLTMLAPGNPQRAEECGRLATVLTTHETYFLRDANQMALLRQRILPGLIAARRERADLALKIWSCGCATGEEPASIAILLGELLPDLAQWRVEIVATDVSAEILARASRAIYGEWSFRGCTAEFRSDHFQQQGEHWRLAPALRRMIRYARVDLIQDPLPAPEAGLFDFDLIVCRNVFIYFEPHAISLAATKLAACLRPGGALMTGHGELRRHRPDSLAQEMHPESAIYRKAGPKQLNAAMPRQKSGTTASPANAIVPPAAACSSTTPSEPPLPSIRRRHGTAARVRSAALKTHAPERPADRHEATLEAAWRLADQGQLEPAQLACTRLLAADPMNAGAYFLAAVLATELGDAARARAALRGALYLDPNMIAAHVHLERLQTMQANLQSAGKTRETIRTLIASLPAEAPIPYMGDTRVTELADQLAVQETTGPAAAPG